MSDDKNQVTITDRILNVVIPPIYHHRMVTHIILLALTVFFGYQASQIQPDAGFEKSIPQQHEYMQIRAKWARDFGGGNTILVSLINRNGYDGENIYNEEFLTKLSKVTDEVFFVEGVNRKSVTSLFTPNTRYIEVVEGGLAGEDVIPSDYVPDERNFRRIRDNVGKAQIIGRLVTESENGAMITAEIEEFDPFTGEKRDLKRIADQLEEIRQKYETDDIGIHIIGFAKVVGDVTDAIPKVVGFFGIALVFTLVMLWMYLGSFKLSLLPLGSAIVAVIWEFGLFRFFGYGLDPFAILVPFLILSVSVSHGVQYANAWVAEIFHDKSPYDASLITFRRLAIPGTTALITDVAGFLTILLIDIDIIQEMAINATLGMAAIIVTNKMLMPIWLTYVTVGNIDKFKVGQAKRDKMGDGMWKFLAKATRTGPAIVIIALAACAAAWGFYKYPQLQVGDAQAGVPELWPESRYNRDTDAIVSNFSIGADIITIIGETQPEGNSHFQLMEQLDRFEWHMRNTDGVQSVITLGTFAKLVNSGFQDGRLDAVRLPRNSFSLAQSTNYIPTTSGLWNDKRDGYAIHIFTKDHKAETIIHIVDEVKKFNAENKANFIALKDDVDEAYCDDKYAASSVLKAADDNVAILTQARSDQALIDAAIEESKAASAEYAQFDKICPMNFALATGNVGVMAATNEVIKAKEIVTIAIVYVVILIFMYLSFWQIGGVLCVVLPLSLVSLTAYGVMAELQIGMKVATLPVVALAVGIGVDYGIYIYSTIQEGLYNGEDLETAMYNTLRKTGKAVVFTGITLGGGVITWLWSDLKFQADMGLMLLYMFTANMFGAILLLGALARFLAKPPKNKPAIAH